MASLMSVLMLLPHWLPQHLVQWDAGNPECLLQLVKELIQQYHHYQCQRLRESSRLLFEYDSLLEDPNYGRNMEIYAGRKNSWVGNCFMTLWCFAFLKAKSPAIVSQHTSEHNLQWEHIPKPGHLWIRNVITFIDWHEMDWSNEVCLSHMLSCNYSTNCHRLKVFSVFRH